MLAQVSGNLSGISLVVSIIALLIALFSLPTSILQYVTWLRDAALWIALAFVVAIVVKIGYQRSYGEGKPVTQAVMEFLGSHPPTANQNSDSEPTANPAKSG